MTQYATKSHYPDTEPINPSNAERQARINCANIVGFYSARDWTYDPVHRMHATYSIGHLFRSLLVDEVAIGNDMPRLPPRRSQFILSSSFVPSLRATGILDKLSFCVNQPYTDCPHRRAMPTPQPGTCIIYHLWGSSWFSARAPTMHHTELLAITMSRTPLKRPWPSSAAVDSMAYPAWIHNLAWDLRP